MSREKRKQRMSEHYEEALHNVEIILNTIHKMELKRDIIDAKYLDNDLESRYYDLEIGLALCGIIIRKLDESSFIKITGEFRKNINVLIHSNDLKYLKETKEIIVYSKTTNSQLSLAEFVLECQQIFNNLLII